MGFLRFFPAAEFLFNRHRFNLRELFFILFQKLFIAGPVKILRGDLLPFFAVEIG